MAPASDRPSILLSRLYRTPGFRSDMSRNLSGRLKLFTRGAAAALALALPDAAVLGQGQDGPAPEATAAPRNIVPVEQMPIDAMPAPQMPGDKPEAPAPPQDVQTPIG